MSGSPFNAYARRGSGDKRYFARQTAAKLLVHLVDLPAEIHLFFTVISAKEDKLACLEASRRPDRVPPSEARQSSVRCSRDLAGDGDCQSIRTRTRVP